RLSGALLWSRRLYDYRFYFDEIHNVEGDIIESGVHWGYGILAFLQLTGNSKNRKIFGFDSFSGHSSPVAQDYSGGSYVNLASSFAVSQNDVWKTLELGTGESKENLQKRVELISGWIQETMPNFQKKA